MLNVFGWPFMWAVLLALGIIWWNGPPPGGWW